MHAEFQTHRYRRKNGRKRRYKWSFAAQCAGRVSKLQVLEMIKTLSRFLKNLAVRDGHLRYGYIIILVLCGGGLVISDLYRWDTGWVYIVGLGIAAFGGFSAQAYILRIRPFEDPPYPPNWINDQKEEVNKGN